MATNRSQIPLHYKMLGADGKLTQPWAFWFQQFQNNLPPSGSGFVVDGSAGTYGQMTLFQGADALKGTAVTGYIYFALDTGKIYVAIGGVWFDQTEAFIGDATKPLHSNVLTLNTVNPAVGTFGTSSLIPRITVNGKGLITNVDVEPVYAVAGGDVHQIQRNEAGNLFGDSGLTFQYLFHETILNINDDNNPDPLRTHIIINGPIDNTNAHNGGGLEILMGSGLDLGVDFNNSLVEYGTPSDMLTSDQGGWGTGFRPGSVTNFPVGTHEGGSMVFTGGDSTNNFNNQGGSGVFGGGSANIGANTLGTNHGGDFIFEGGNAVGAVGTPIDNVGGRIIFTGGPALGNGMSCGAAGGAILLTAGEASGDTSGNVGGNVNITGGRGHDPAGIGGDVDILGGLGDTASGTVNINGVSILYSGTIISGVWNGTAIDETHGGTNQITYTTGDILYASAADTLSVLPIGSAAQVLTVTGGVPVWAVAGGSTAPGYEYQTAAGAQTIFNTALATVANGGGRCYLNIFVNGIKQVEGALLSYTVTGANQITFNAGLIVNDQVEFNSFI